jgi:hypothetical protein
MNLVRSNFHQKHPQVILRKDNLLGATLVLERHGIDRHPLYPVISRRGDQNHSRGAMVKTKIESVYVSQAEQGKDGVVVKVVHAQYYTHKNTKQIILRKDDPKRE